MNKAGGNEPPSFNLRLSYRANIKHVFVVAYGAFLVTIKNDEGDFTTLVGDNGLSIDEAFSETAVNEFNQKMSSDDIYSMHLSVFNPTGDSL